jgi:hypothetical protein
MDKIMETAVKDTHFFINMELGHHLPVTQLVFVLEQTDVSSEQPLMENRTSSSGCLRDNGGNLLLMLPSKADHSGFMIFNVGKCAS